MAKDAFYFPHDSNAHDDPKMMMLLEQLGLEGYGIYWLLIETLRDQENYQCPLALLPALARRYQSSVDKFRAVINSYDLFSANETVFFSESLLRRMTIIDDKRAQARQAVLTRWYGKQPQKDTPLLPPHNASNTDVLPLLNVSNTSKVKESKGKESKGKNKKEILKKVYGEFKNVLLSDEEYGKLEEKFNSATPAKIENLSSYKASKGKTYKSDYATILTWDRKDDATLPAQKPVIPNEPINSDIGGVNPKKFENQKFNNLVQR